MEQEELDSKELARVNRRDKRIQRKKTGMRVDSSAKKLAEILHNKQEKS